MKRQRRNQPNEREWQWKCREPKMKKLNRDNHGACAHQTNVEETENGAKWTLAKLVNTKMQMKTSEKRKRHHAKCKWKPVRGKSGTTRNKPHNAKQEKEARLSEAEWSVRENIAQEWKFLILTRGTYYVGYPTDVIPGQILSYFPQNSLACHEEDISLVGKSQQM